MLFTLRGHVLDLLQADSRLLQGGPAFNPGGGAIDPVTHASATPAWLGVKRPANGIDQSIAGWVNVFDSSYEESASTHRPAIYVGTEGMGSRDRLEFSAISSGGYIEYRILILPLIILATSSTKWKAEAARDQLVNNIQRILADHLVETGYWYEMTIPGESGGGSASKLTSTSASGPPPHGVAEGRAPLPLQIKYAQSKFSPP